MALFNPVFNCLTPKGIKRSKTQSDEGLTTADEAPQGSELESCPSVGQVAG